MGAHDEYGKRILLEATAGAVDQYGPGVEIDYGTEFPARIDGAVGGSIAIEIESRTGKQVRGAVLDLICHSYPKKLLVLLPVHMSNPVVIAEQCRNILAKFHSAEDFRVIVLDGHGHDPKPRRDVRAVVQALRALGFQESA